LDDLHPDLPVSFLTRARLGVPGTTTMANGKVRVKNGTPSSPWPRVLFFPLQRSISRPVVLISIPYDRFSMA